MGRPQRYAHERRPDPRFPAGHQDLMNQFVARTATGLILEDLRYQGAVNALVVAYRMIGRITDGDFTLPAVKCDARALVVGLRWWTERLEDLRGLGLTRLRGWT